MKPTPTPGTRHQTPERDSKGWHRIILRGCGGSYDAMNGDYDCDHGYTWACEECPIGIVASDALYEKWEKEHQGPPRPPGMYCMDYAAHVGAEYNPDYMDLVQQAWAHRAAQASEQGHQGD